MRDKPEKIYMRDDGEGYLELTSETDINRTEYIRADLAKPSDVFKTQPLSLCKSGGIFDGKHCSHVKGTTDVYCDLSSLPEQRCVNMGAKPSEWISVTVNCDECGNRVEAKFKISKIISLGKGASIHGICSKCGKLPISLETIPTR